MGADVHACVMQVMAQLSDIGEEDVFEELDMLEHTDLSNVEYMVSGGKGWAASADLGKRLAGGLVAVLTHEPQEAASHSPAWPERWTLCTS